MMPYQFVFDDVSRHTYNHHSALTETVHTYLLAFRTISYNSKKL